jgi:hypothetical protein
MVVWSAPLWSMTTGVSRSGCGWRVEAIHELDEHFLEAGLVVVGVVPDECDHLAVTVAACRLSPRASCTSDPSRRARRESGGAGRVQPPRPRQAWQREPDPLRRFELVRPHPGLRRRLAPSVFHPARAMISCAGASSKFYIRAPRHRPRSACHRPVDCAASARSVAAIIGRNLAAAF